MTIKSLLLSTVLAGLSVSLPTIAATTETYKFRGETAYASFSQINDCITTDISISAFENITRSKASGPSSLEEASLFYYIYNSCTGEYVADGYGYSNNVTFNVDGFKSGTLNGTISVYDFTSGTEKPVEVALTFTGVGENTRSRFNTSFKSKTYVSTFRSTGTSRYATASGSVILNGTNSIADTTSNYAYLGQAKEGAVTIIKER